MRIKLKHRLPLETKHGMTEGREFEVLRKNVPQGRGTSGVWVMGDAGEECLVMSREYSNVPIE